MGDIVTMDDLTNQEIVAVLDDAERLVPVARGDVYLPLLQGKVLANMFFENSTRTQASFELAGKRLGANVMNLSMEASSLKKGETLIDTALTLNAMQPDLLVVRHPQSGAVDLLSQKVNCSVLKRGRWAT